MADPDFIIVGAGHNSLITAAYLAQAGLRVAVIEGHERIGGDTITEELTLPGFHHDLLLQRACADPVESAAARE